MNKDKVEISADLQMDDKVFKVEGYITNPNLSNIEVVITKVTENETDITRYYQMFDDSEKFEFALKEAYYKRKLQTGNELLNNAKKVLEEGINSINEVQRFFVN